MLREEKDCNSDKQAAVILYERLVNEAIECSRSIDSENVILVLILKLKDS
jgi:hypothetical protein